MGKERLLNTKPFINKGENILFLHLPFFLKNGLLHYSIRQHRIRGRTKARETAVFTNNFEIIRPEIC